MNVVFEIKMNQQVEEWNIGLYILALTIINPSFQNDEALPTRGVLDHLTAETIM